MNVEKNSGYCVEVGWEKLIASIHMCMKLSATRDMYVERVTQNAMSIGAVGRQRSLPNKWALYLLNQFNTLLQIHAKIDEGPFDTLALVFLLLQDKHVVIEELLQFLVGEVNTELFEAVELYDSFGKEKWLVMGKSIEWQRLSVPKQQFSYCSCKASEGN